LITAIGVSLFLQNVGQLDKFFGNRPSTMSALLPNDDGVAPALTATYKGRNTFDVALVLDKSGSMQDFPPGAIRGCVFTTSLFS